MFRIQDAVDLGRWRRQPRQAAWPVATRGRSEEELECWRQCKVHADQSNKPADSSTAARNTYQVRARRVTDDQTTTTPHSTPARLPIRRLQRPINSSYPTATSIHLYHGEYATPRSSASISYVTEKSPTKALPPAAADATSIGNFNARADADDR
jgi:hypothetical protein